MQNDLIETIRRYGHWRINLRPKVVPAEPVLLGRCQELVEKSSVSLRGWDFPHTSRGNTDDGGYLRGKDFVENWTNWFGMIEFWRIYKSTQFISYLCLREDTKPEEHGNLQNPILDVVGTIYSVTEFCEFLHRLTNNGLYQQGATLSISLINTRGRVLRAGRGRVPFFDPKVTDAERLEVNREIHPRSWGDIYQSVAVDLCIELFDYFGWNPDRTQIQVEQEKFYRREWAY